MKKLSITIAIFTLFFALLPTNTANAQFIAGSWTSNLSCINQSELIDATVELFFYEESTGNEISLGTDVILAGMSANFVLSALPAGSIGSLVIQSSQPLTCAADYAANTTGTPSNPYRFAATKGFEVNETGPVMYVSQIEKAFYGWNSYIAIQNTSSTATDVTISFVDRATNTYPDLSLTIPGYGNEVIMLEDVPTLPEMFIGAATISSDDSVTPLAVSTAFYNAGISPATSQIHAWNGSAKGSHTLYAPYIVMNYYRYNSGIMIQNIGDTPTSFKVTYTFAGTDYVYQHPVMLNVGETKDFYLPDVAVLSPVNNIPNNQRFGKALIEATLTDGTFNPDGELIANVNQENRGGSGIPIEFAGNGGTYAAFLSTAGSTTNYISKWMVHVGGFSSGVHISNYSLSPTTCNFTFPTDSDADFTTVIAPNSFFTRWAPNTANLDPGYNAGVKIECDSEVFVIVNASNDPDVGKHGDSFYQMSAGIQN